MAVYGSRGQRADSNPKGSSVARSERIVESNNRGRRYKSIPENWKVIPPTRLAAAIANIEAVLLEISPDGSLNGNPFDWKPTIPALTRWTQHLRTALQQLTK
jgi:hypothetical protein